MSQPPVDLPRPAAVIFDLDGTLVDTVETRIRAWLAVFAEEAIPAARPQVAGLIGSDGRRLAREVAEAAGMPLGPGRDEAIDARSGAIFADLNRQPAALPGVAALLERLGAAAIPWAIATSSRRKQIAASVDALRLTQAPLIVDGTHVAHAKPAPDLLLLAADRLGADPADCWYVGDATWDMLAAVAAGMPAIGVTSGAVDAATLFAAGAARVVASLAELEI
ncbi:MAG: HAD family hydrolase [Chloroflexota bacterium]|nr:HAD family hydrolase [Chloroflexota bacterium]